MVRDVSLLRGSRGRTCVSNRIGLGSGRDFRNSSIRRWVRQVNGWSVALMVSVVRVRVSVWVRFVSWLRGSPGRNRGGGCTRDGG